MDAKPRLLDQVRQRLRTLHYSYRTEQQYVFWVRRFILFHGKRHPSVLGAPEVETFLTHLAVRRLVSASTQSQALSALPFLYSRCSRSSCRGSTASCAQSVHTDCRWS